MSEGSEVLTQGLLAVIQGWKAGNESAAPEGCSGVDEDESMSAQSAAAPSSLISIPSSSCTAPAAAVASTAAATAPSTTAPSTGSAMVTPDRAQDSSLPVVTQLFSPQSDNMLPQHLQEGRNVGTGTEDLETLHSCTEGTHGDNSSAQSAAVEEEGEQELHTQVDSGGSERSSSGGSGSNSGKVGTAHQSDVPNI